MQGKNDNLTFQTSTEMSLLKIFENQNNITLIEETDQIYLYNFTIEKRKEYIFDRADVRAIFITLYTLVFCCCFFGNLLVIMVVTLSRRLRSITNFFLANLALADFCVGVFCVLQNLSIYLMPSWIFGDFLCKMYQFTHSLSYTASIFILVVICTERYFAIIHPITCKQILTPNRLRVSFCLTTLGMIINLKVQKDILKGMLKAILIILQLVIVGVWITSALYSSPKFIWMKTITNQLEDGQMETICIPQRKKFDLETFDMVNFALLYVTPLCVMTVLYTKIAVTLWRSSRGMERAARVPPVAGCFAAHCSRHPEPAETQVCVSGAAPVVSTWRARAHHTVPFSHLSHNVLRARRGVIRMLIVVVLTFAICNLPFHARKMWQYWSSNYEGGSDFTIIFTPLTFLVTYFNSGINPFLYAFLSRNFRKGMKELVFCSCKGQNKSDQLLFYQQQNQQTFALRRSSTRSTRAACSSVAATNGGDT